MFAIVERGDLVAATVSSALDKIPAIPENLRDKPLGELRFQGGRIRHLSEFKTFFVDGDGVKRVEAGADRVPVSCAWDAELVRDGSSWRVKTSKDELRAYAATARFRREVGGISINGAAIRTDRESQGLIAGAMLRAQLNAAASFKFKAAGGFVELSGLEMQAIAAAVGEHVQACFSLEAELLAEIEAGTVKTKDQIDARFAAL